MIFLLPNLVPIVNPIVSLLKLISQDFMGKHWIENKECLTINQQSQRNIRDNPFSSDFLNYIFQNPPKLSLSSSLFLMSL